MKAIVTIVFAALLCGGTSASAQTFSDPARVINNQRVDLQPLINWWTNVVSVEKQNRRLKKDQRLPVPERPLTSWVRVTTDRITNSGLVWIAEVQIQETPEGKTEKQTVVIKHAPLAGKQQFDSAVVGQREAADAQSHAEAVKEYQSDRASQAASYRNSYNEMHTVAPSFGFHDQATQYGKVADDAKRQAKSAEQRAESARCEQARLGAITQGRTKFHLDTFALKTGELYNGIPVYDLGLAFGR
jgi:hypothetical protein